MTPLFSPEETGETRDNAVGAVGRLILAGRGALPLEQLLPTFLGGLPLRDDLREATPAYTALAALVTSGDTAPRVLALAPQVLSAFGAAAVQPGLPAEALMQVGRAVASLQAAYAQQLGAAVASLPAEQQQGLARLMAEAQQQQQ
ncbi:hypothetical protein FOA52_015506 [Chlamydomonas sp. UWO 241]|nr:hypothetical protein FOA52_015506 [Chlamydomonas sp. UWO 241]